MRSLKKLLAVLLALTLMASVMVVPAFAAQSYSYEDEAKALYDLGLFKGTSATEYKPNLDARLERQEGAVLVLRLFNLEDEANKMDEKEAKALLTEKFKDADQIGAWAVKAIAYAVKNGIINGRPDGNFAPKDPLLGKEFAKMILEELGQKYDFQTAAADLAAISDLTAAEAIKFNDKILIRDDVVGISFASLAATYADGQTVLAVLAKDAAFKAKAMELGLITIVKINTTVAPISVKIGEKVELPAKAEVEYSDGSKAEVLVAWTSVDTSKAGSFKAVGSVANFDGKIEAAITVVDDVLKVESVTADNLKEIVVKFNKELDKTTAETAANYILNPSNAGALTPKLQADGKTVVITVATNLSNQGTYKLTVDKVKDADGKAITKVIPEFTVFDAVLPTVDSINITGPSSFELIFSEPISTIGTVEVKSANTSLAVNSKGTAGTNKMSITLYSSFADGVEYSITVKDYADYANYRNVIKTFNISYVKDATPPSVAVDSATQQYVVVKFNKPVTGVTKDHFYHTYTAWQPMAIYATKADMDADTAGTVSTITNATANVTTVYVRFATDASANQYPLPAGAVTVNVLSKANNFEIKDNWGNKLADTTLTANVTADTEAPTVSKVEVASNTSLNVTFSKAVANAETTANYELLKADGTAISGLTLTATPAADKKSVTLNLGGTTFVGNTFILNVKNIEDTTLNKNKMAAYSTNITFEDKQYDGVDRVEFDSGKTPKLLYVIYKEEVNDTALNIANYRINDGGTIRTLSGYATFFGSNKVVKIELSDTEAGYISTGVDTLLVANVEDVHGNKGNGFQESIVIVGIGSAIPGVATSGITATTKNTVSVQFDQELISVVPTDFQLSVDGGVTWNTPTAQELALNSTGTLVKLTFSQNIDADVPGTVQIRATFSADTKNVFDTKPTNIAASTPVDKIVPEIITDGVETVDLNNDGKIDHIKITFNEAIQQLYISPDKFTVTNYTVVDAYGITGGAPVFNGRGTATIGNSAVVYLRVTQKDAVDGNAVPSVSIAAGLRDIPGNAYPATTSAITPKDKVAPVVVTALTAQIPISASATITFSEELSAASKNAVQTAITAATATGTLTYSWNGAILTINNTSTANATAFAAGTSVSVDLTDLASNTTAAAAAEARVIIMPI